MGKKRKKHPEQQGGQQQQQRQHQRTDHPRPADSAYDSDEMGGLDPIDVATAVDVVSILTADPELFATKPFKALRAALDPLVQLQLRKYDPVDYAARVTTALRLGKGHEALLALQGMRANGQVAKQGTVQRWARDCDAISEADGLRVKLLQAVLLAGKAPTADRGGDADGVAAGAAEAEAEGSATAGAAVGSGEAPSRGDAGSATDAPAEAVVVRHAAWDASTAAGEARGASGEADGTDADDSAAATQRGVEADYGIRVVMQEAGPDRQPPNHYDLRIYACAPSSVAFAPLDADAARRLRRVDVPSVPGAFVLLNLLSRAECRALLSIAERMGYTPDHPLSRPAPSGIGACEWVVSREVERALFQRAQTLLPPTVAGGQLAGLNCRWRLFRYTDKEGAVYRPHIDGSWPGSGLDADGRYVHDAWGDRRSRLTFLVYLTSGFEGGSTTFYLPDGDGGGLHAREVRPVQGSVLCFPQGSTASLLHEGSAVLRGVKVVIRTDVLYTFPSR